MGKREKSLRVIMALCIVWNSVQTVKCTLVGARTAQFVFGKLHLENPMVYGKVQMEYKNKTQYELWREYGIIASIILEVMMSRWM